MDKERLIKDRQTVRGRDIIEKWNERCRGKDIWRQRQERDERERELEEKKKERGREGLKGDAYRERDRSIETIIEKEI